MTPRHTIQITNNIQHLSERNNMVSIANTSAINLPFTRNFSFSKRGTRSMTFGNATGIQKYKVQQTRLLHLAKGRKVSRKVICDAASPERELRQDDAG